MTGLNHVAHDQAATEVARLLRELADRLEQSDVAMQPGDTHILRDANGNRIGVADVFRG